MGEIDVSVEKIRGFFKPGPLAEKCDEIHQLRAAGDTLFFDGEVDWQVALPDDYKVMEGRAESMDAAFSDMLACLLHLSAQHDEKTIVTCSIRLAESDDADR